MEWVRTHSASSFARVAFKRATDPDGRSYARPGVTASTGASGASPDPTIHLVSEAVRSRTVWSTGAWIESAWIEAVWIEAVQIETVRTLD